MTLRAASSTRSSGVRSGMDQRARRSAGELGVEDGRQDLVVDADEPARRLGGGGGLGDDRGDALADVTHDVVEHPGVVRSRPSRARAARSSSDVRAHRGG